MLAEGIMLYVLFIKVFNAKNVKFWYFIPLGWGKSTIDFSIFTGTYGQQLYAFFIFAGLPLIVVTITAAIRSEQYGVPNK